MRAEPLGDSAFILRELDVPAYEIANALNALSPPGLIEAVASYDTVGLYIEPTLWQGLPTDLRAIGESERQEHSIPVCYEMGEDTKDVCSQLGISPERLVELHTSQPYTCFAIGFCPGFPYLGYLPEGLRGVPRRGAPRIRIEPGSVAITGDQTSVYPLTRPGGWALIGRTPLTIADEEDGYFPIKAGDKVRFYAITGSEFEVRRGERL